MKILITGGGGFLGSHLSEALLSAGHEVFILEPGGTSKVRHLVGHERFRIVRDSVMSVDILDSLIAQVDLVYHLAAVVGVEYYVGDPYDSNMVARSCSAQPRRYTDVTRICLGRRTLNASWAPRESIGGATPRQKQWVNTFVLPITSLGCR